MLSLLLNTLPTLASNDVRRELAWFITHIRHNRRLRFSPILSSRHRLYHMVYQRVFRNKPLQYILQSQPFNSVDIIVRPPILIPRAETEEWAADLSDAVIRNYTRNSSSPIRVLDICSGSGCIGLSIANRLVREKIPCHLVGIDSNRYAIRLARLNARKLDISAHFLHADIFNNDLYETLSQYGPFDIIVSNPPYVLPAEYVTLDKDVTEWEDPGALIGTSHNVLNYYDRIVQLSTNYLSQDKFQFGQVWMEIGAISQAHHISRFIARNQFNFTVETKQDCFGSDRIVILHKI